MCAAQALVLQLGHAEGSLQAGRGLLARLEVHS